MVSFYACAVAENSAVIVQGGVSFATIAGRILLQANVPTLVPTILIRAVLWIATYVASSAFLDLGSGNGDRTAGQETCICLYQ